MKIPLSLFTALFISISTLAQSSEFESINFEKADSIADKYDKFKLNVKNEKQLVELLTKNLSTDVEKFRAIFKWITNNISYDVDLYHQHIGKEDKLKHHKGKLEQWRKRFNNQLMNRLYAKKSTICSGYSYLLESMCRHAGIQCQTIEGYGRSTHWRIGYGEINHAWNAVWLNNKWNLCDPTWASGYVSDETNRFVRIYDKAYFLTEPSLFIANHYPKNTTWILMYEKPTLKDFLNAPYKTSGFISTKINHYKPRVGQLSVKSDSVMRFAFISNLSNESIKKVLVKEYKKIKKHFVFQGQSQYDVQVDNEGYYYFDYCLDGKGTYRLRISIQRKVLFYHSFTYEIISKR